MFDELEVVNGFREKGGGFPHLTAANLENRTAEQYSVRRECHSRILSGRIVNKRGTIVRVVGTLAPSYSIDC